MKNLEYTNALMDLVWHYTKSSMGLSENQHQKLKALWEGLTPYGKDYFQIWAEENDFTLPNYCR